MTKKYGYVLLRKNFEYNDEYYYETDGGKPVKIYTNLDLAEEARWLKEIEVFKSIDPINYAESDVIEELETHIKELAEIYEETEQEIKDRIEDCDFYKKELNLDIKKVTLLSDIFNIEFYQILKTEIE